MFAGTDCPGRPVAGKVLDSLTGLKTWYTSKTAAETQLAPRSVADYGGPVVKPDAGAPTPDTGVEPGLDAAAPTPDTGVAPGLDAAAPGLDAAEPGLDAAAPGLDAAN